MSEKNNNNKLLTLKEAAELLGFSERRLRERAEVGRIKFEKREGKDLWFTKAALLEYEKEKWWQTNRLKVTLITVLALAVVCAGAYKGFRIFRRHQSAATVANARKMLEKKDVKNAIEYLKLAVDEDPRSIIARQEYARVLRLTGQKEEQEKQLRAALAIAPNSLEALQSLAELLFEKGQFGEAETHFLHILKLDSGHFMANYYEAMLLAKKGETQNARAHLLKMLEKRPGFAPAEMALADLYTGEGKLDEAQQLYGKNASGSLTALLNEAVISQKKGDMARAADIYNKILLNEPVMARAYNNIAWGMISTSPAPDKKTLEQAFVLARKGFLLNPQDATIADTVAWTLFLAGRDKEAIEQIDNALKLDPNLAIAYFHKGRMLIRAKRNDEALAALTKAKEMSKSGDGGVTVSTVDYFITEAGKK